MFSDKLGIILETSFSYTGLLNFALRENDLLSMPIM
jgi:hypothetical protein